MENSSVSDKDREMAQVCMSCPMCENARKDQKGFFYSCVKNFAEAMCPYCQAYERVYGCKAHEPVEA
jgi:ubiquitin